MPHASSVLNTSTSIASDTPPGIPPSASPNASVSASPNASASASPNASPNASASASPNASVSASPVTVSGVSSASGSTGASAVAAGSSLGASPSAETGASDAAKPSPAAKPRFEYLDAAKGFAALFVVLLHLAEPKTLFTILAPWHIWQAMPIFLLVAGITGQMSCRKFPGIIGNHGWQKNREDLLKYYRGLPAKALALYIPYALVTVLYHMWSGEQLGLELFFNTMLMGYLGPGGYFVPLIVQHLIFFPLVLSLRAKVGSDLRFLGIALGLSAVLELLFSFADVESTRFIYRIFYFRYLFACCLGAVLADHAVFGKRTFVLLAFAGAVYIGFVSYLSSTGGASPQYWNLFFIRADDWYFQHYPSYFFTAFLVFSLRKHIDRIPHLFIRLGKASYEIFIFQMLFFITVYLSLRGYYGAEGVPFWVKVPSFFFCVWGGMAYARLKVWWKNTPLK